MGIHTPKRDTGMENEITHQKRCGIGERGKEGPCDSLTEINSIAHIYAVKEKVFVSISAKVTAETGWDKKVNSGVKLRMPAVYRNAQAF